MALIREVCENYDIDGIELDYFRHLHSFPSIANGAVATQTQCDLITDMMTEIREMTEEVGLNRGRPILVAVRVPDSIGYCLDMGFDLEQWLDNGLVDIVIGGGYFRFNKWSNLVNLKNQYDSILNKGFVAKVSTLAKECKRERNSNSYWGMQER